MRISDWSSDVCSSDLVGRQVRQIGGTRPLLQRNLHGYRRHGIPLAGQFFGGAGGCKQAPGQAKDAKGQAGIAKERDITKKIGRASCRERVCQYVEISVVAVTLKKKKQQKRKKN